jgi:hypothetical protein
MLYTSMVCFCYCMESVLYCPSCYILQWSVFVIVWGLFYTVCFCYCMGSVLYCPSCYILQWSVFVIVWGLFYSVHHAIYFNGLFLLLYGVCSILSIMLYTSMVCFCYCMGSVLYCPSITKTDH